MINEFYGKKNGKLTEIAERIVREKRLVLDWLEKKI